MPVELSISFPSSKKEVSLKATKQRIKMALAQSGVIDIDLVVLSHIQYIAPKGLFN